MLKITQLWVYPIKSCQGVSVSSVDLLASGLKNDREMMIVDSEGQFVTQRSDAILAHIGVDLPNDNQVKLIFADQSITFTKQYQQSVAATVWKRSVPAFDQGDAVAEFLSDIIGRKVRLLATRPVDTENAEKAILFQDGQAVHLLTEKSLQHAQEKLLAYQIDVRRFRPNIVIGEAEDVENSLSPFAEDQWKNVGTDKTEMMITKLCERCTVPGINPQTLDKETAVYHYFKTYRLVNKKPMFGICGYGTKLGCLQVGDRVTVR